MALYASSTTHRERSNVECSTELPTENVPGFLRLLVVGVDGSDGSRHALDWAARLAAATGAEVLAVHVLTYNRELVRDFTLDTMRTWRRELETDVRTRWVEGLAAHDVKYRSQLSEHDSPAAGLLEVADRESADLLVVGAKGHGNIAGRILGSVSYRVTHGAHQPVVVVPPARHRPSQTDSA